MPVVRQNGPGLGARVRLLGDVNVLECAPDGIDPSRWNPFVRTAEPSCWVKHWPDLYAVMVNSTGQGGGR